METGVPYFDLSIRYTNFSCLLRRFYTGTALSLSTSPRPRQAKSTYRMRTSTSIRAVGPIEWRFQFLWLRYLNIGHMATQGTVAIFELKGLALLNMAIALVSPIYFVFLWLSRMPNHHGWFVRYTVKLEYICSFHRRSISEHNNKQSPLFHCNSLSSQ